MANLKDFREEIDKIDKNIINLLLERVEVVKDVAQYKKKHDLPIYNPEREAELLQSRTKMAQDRGLDKEYIEKIFILLMEYSKYVQGKI